MSTALFDGAGCGKTHTTDLGPREASACPTIRSSWVQARATTARLGPLTTTGAPCGRPGSGLDRG